MPAKEYVLSAIGRVESGPQGSVLKIAQKYRPALLGLDGFSHINVLWWSHHLEAPEHRGILEAGHPYVNAPARLGIFATRSPMRPNPVCISTVSLLNVDLENGLVIVAWIDAEDGTPILYIKPYHPSSDRVREVHMPEWCRDWPQWIEDSAEFDWGSVFVNAR